jgi:hypothetical protein
MGRHHSSRPCSGSFLATRASRPDSSRPSLLRLPSAPHSSPCLGAFLQSQWASQASLPPVHDAGPKAPTGPFACHGPCRQRQYVWLPLIATGLRPRRQAHDEAVGAGKATHTTERRSQVPAPASCQAGIPENPKGRGPPRPGQPSRPIRQPIRWPGRRRSASSPG